VSLTSSLLKPRTRPKKRRKLNEYKNNSAFVFPLDAFLNVLQGDGEEQRTCFEDIIDPWLEELLRARRKWEISRSDLDGLVNFPMSFEGNDFTDLQGNKVRALRPYEAVSYAQELSKQTVTPSQGLLLRKLKVQSVS